MTQILKILLLALGSGFLLAGAPGPQTLKLTKILDIGPDQGEQFIWAGTDGNLDVDAEGNMYVTDANQNRVLVISPKGKVINTIGRKGDGPGEFQNLRSFYLIEGGAVAFESLQLESKLHYFDTNMKFQKRVDNANDHYAYRSVQFSPDGQWYGANTTSLDPRNGKEIVVDALFDKGGKARKEILRNEMAIFDSNKITRPKYWADFLASRLKAESEGLFGYVTFDRKGNTYTAQGGKYEVKRYDKNLKETLVYKRDYKPVFRPESEIGYFLEQKRESYRAQLPGQLQFIMTPKLMEMAREKVEFKKVKPPIFGICAMDDGNLLVIHDFSYTTNKATADIFSPDGTYLGSFTHSGDGMKSFVFMKGKAYALEDIAGERHLTCYKYEYVAAG